VIARPLTPRRVALAALTAVLAGAATPAAAQYFHLYLSCSGKVTCGGRPHDATLDLALRDNNMTALVQRSNVLPVGERLKYQASPALYSMKMVIPDTRTKVFVDLFRGTLYVLEPSLRRLGEVRLSIDRQTAVLEGEMIDSAGEPLALLKLRCVPKTNEDIPAPKF
jgi:hypothetical protein